MAQQDITGLLTGIFAGDQAAQQQKLLSQQAVARNPNLLASAQTQIGRAPEQLARMRQNVGGMFGQDMRSAGEQVQEQLKGLDISTPTGQQQAVKLIERIDAPKALALQNAFAQQALTNETTRADAGIGQINAQQYTPESVQQYNLNFQNTGIKDYSLLKEIDLAGKTFEIKTMENIVKSIGARQEQFQSSMKRQQEYTQIERLLDAGLNTGALAGLSTTFKGVLSDVLGVEISGLSEAEALESISNKLALGIRNPASGMGLPGATSNRDLDFLLAAIPGLRKSEEGNRLMIKIARQEHKLAGDLRREQQRIIKANGGKPPLDIQDKLAEYFENYQIDPSLKEKANELLLGNKPTFDQKRLNEKLAALKESRKRTVNPVRGGS